MFTKSKNVASILATYAVKLNPTLSLRGFFFYAGQCRVLLYRPLQAPAFNWKTLKLNKVINFLF